MNRRIVRLHRSRRGVSLLEVMLSLTILAIALAVLGELVSMGTRNAASARDLTRSQLLCESKFAELTTGVITVTSQQMVEFDTDPDWYYSVDVQTLDTSGLISVTVTAEQQSDSERRAAPFSLTRWMPDPSVEWPESFEEMYGVESTSTGESTDTGGAMTGGTTGGTTGGR